MYASWLPQFHKLTFKDQDHHELVVITVPRHLTDKEIRSVTKGHRQERVEIQGFSALGSSRDRVQFAQSQSNDDLHKRVQSTNSLFCRGSVQIQVIKSKGDKETQKMTFLNRLESTFHQQTRRR
jgi:hypothetical protein